MAFLEWLRQDVVNISEGLMSHFEPGGFFSDCQKKKTSFHFWFVSKNCINSCNLFLNKAVVISNIRGCVGGKTEVCVNHMLVST